MPLKKTQLPAFQGQKLLLDRQSAAKPGQIPVASDNAMARNYDRYAIGAVRQSHCARSIGTANTLGNLSVADSLSVWDFLQVTPDEKLKFSAIKDEWQIEVG